MELTQHTQENIMNILRFVRTGIKCFVSPIELVEKGEFFAEWNCLYVSRLVSSTVICFFPFFMSALKIDAASKKSNC